MNLLIKADGSVQCVYDETVDLGSLGPLTIRRASHVEPDADGCWLADLSPVEGPMLGPFDSRSAALDAEHQWLAANWLTSRS